MGGEDLSAFDFDPGVEDASITPQKGSGKKANSLAGPIRGKKMGQSVGSRQVQAAKLATTSGQAAPKKSTQSGVLNLPGRVGKSQESNEVGSGKFFDFNKPKFDGPKKVALRTNGKGLSQKGLDSLRNESEDDIEELSVEERSKPSRKRPLGAAAATGQRQSERLRSEHLFKHDDEKDDCFGPRPYQRKAKIQGGRREADGQRGEGPSMRIRKRDRESNDEGAELDLPPSKRKKADTAPEYKPNGRSAPQRAPEKHAEPQVINLDSEETPQKGKSEDTEPQMAEPRRLIPEESEHPGPSAQVPSEDPSCSYRTARCWLGKFGAHECSVFFDAARLKIRVPPEFVQGGKESLTFTWDLRDLAPGKSFLEEACPTKVVVIAFHFDCEVHPALAQLLDPKSKALPSKYIVFELDYQEWKNRCKKATWHSDLREHYGQIKAEEVAKYTDDRPVTAELRLDPMAEQKRQAAAIASSHYSTRSSRHEKPTIKTFHFPAGDPDAVTLSSSDLARLAPQEFLNDTLIDFYIKFLQMISNDSQTKRIHFLNSFFFKKLMETAQEAKKRGVNRVEAFKRMNKWTRKVDIFDMDYVIIPVNQSLHWSLAILVYPGGGDFPDAKPTGKAVARTPCILQLDSMAGGHSKVEEHLRLYLTELWLASHPKETRPSNMREPLPRFSKAVMPFIPVKVPQQDNHCDCGLFLLHYVEQFIQEPPQILDYRQGNKRSLYKMSPQWFKGSEVTGSKRHILQELILRLAQRLDQGDASILEKDSLRALWFDIVGSRNEKEVPAQGLRRQGDSEQEKGEMNKFNGEDNQQDFEDSLKGLGPRSWPVKAAKSPLPDDVLKDAASGKLEDELEMEHTISVNLPDTPPEKRRAQKEESVQALKAASRRGIDKADEAQKERSPDPLGGYRSYSQFLGKGKAVKEAPEGPGREDHVSETDEETNVQTEGKRARSDSGASEDDQSDRKRMRLESTEREELKARALEVCEFFGCEKGPVSIGKEELFEQQGGRGDAITSEELGAREKLEAVERRDQVEAGKVVEQTTATEALHDLEELEGVPLELETGWFGEAPAEENCAVDSREADRRADVDGAMRKDGLEKSKKEGVWEEAENVGGLQEGSMFLGSAAIGGGESLEEKEKASRPETRATEGRGESNETTGSDEPRAFGRKGQHRRSTSLGGLDGGMELHDRIAASVAQAVQGDENRGSHQWQTEAIRDGQGRKENPQKEARGLAPFLDASPASSEYASGEEAFLDDEGDLHRENVESGKEAEQVRPRSTDEIMQRVRRPPNKEQLSRHELRDEMKKLPLESDEEEASPVGADDKRKSLTKNQKQRIERLWKQLGGNLAVSDLAEQMEPGLEEGTPVSRTEEKKIDRLRKKVVAKVLCHDVESEPEVRSDVKLLDPEACRSELGDEDELTLTGAQRKLESGHVFEERDQEPVSQEFSGEDRGGSASPGHEADSLALQEDKSPEEPLEREEETGKRGLGADSSSLGVGTSVDSEELFHRTAARAKESSPEKEKLFFPPPPDLPYADCPAQPESAKTSEDRSPSQQEANASDDDECAIVGTRFRSTPYGQQKATKVGASSRGRSLENGPKSERTLRNTRHASERAKSLANGKGNLVDIGFVRLQAGKGRDVHTEDEDLSSEQNPEESQEWQHFLRGKNQLAEVDLRHDSSDQEASSPERQVKSLKELCKNLESKGTQGEQKATPSKGPKLSNEVDEKDWGTGGLSPDNRPKRSLRKLYKETPQLQKETPELGEASELLRTNKLSVKVDTSELETPKGGEGERMEPREHKPAPEKIVVDLVDSDDEEGAKAAVQQETAVQSSGQMSSAEKKRALEELQLKRLQTVPRRQARMLVPV